MSETIDKEWLTRITGDPFVDTGGYVIKYLYEQPEHQGKSIAELIEYITHVYVDEWESCINAFFLNSTITQPAFTEYYVAGEKFTKKQLEKMGFTKEQIKESKDEHRKIEETVKYYQSLITESHPDKEGYCAISGRKGKLFIAGRYNTILSGSYGYINFHAAFEPGIYLSKEMLIRTFFVPFGTIMLGGKPGLIQSNNPAITEFFVRKNCEINSQGLRTGISKGVLKSPFNSPAGSVFSFVDYCIDELKYKLYDEKTGEFKMEDVALNIYHFTNFGAEPDLAISTLSAPMFKFYGFCARDAYKEHWKAFLKAHYRTKDAVFNEKDEVWESKKEKTQVEEFKYWYNLVLDRLLMNKSLVRFFLRWCKYHTFPFEIIKTYLILIRNMKPEVVEKCKAIGDFISKQDSTYIKKSLDSLNLAGELRDFRQFLLKVIEKNFQKREAEPILTLDEFEALVPIGSNWREIKDAVIIRIYERIHSENPELIED